MEPSDPQSARNEDARALLARFYEKRPLRGGQALWEFEQGVSMIGMDRDRLLAAAERLSRLGYAERVGMFVYCITLEGVDAFESPEQLDATLPVLRYDAVRMARPKTSAAAPLSQLVVARSEARERLDRQLVEARAIDLTRMPPSGQVDALLSRAQTWSDVTTHLLRVLFDSAEESDRFAASTGIGFRIGADASVKVANASNLHLLRVQRLESVIARLDLFPELAGPPRPAAVPRGDGRSVFVVHGHDLAAKHETARLIERLKLKAIILDEQTNLGRTIIEKFEDHASECSFAVVLVTPDDLGRSASGGDEKPRARQNVIFEMGYFMAKLGRGKVCALAAKGIELPSDLSGVVWVALDDHGAWQMRVAKEMKSAGLVIDLNDL